MDDEGSHTGPTCRGTTALDQAVDAMDFVVGDSDPLVVNEYIYGMGYTAKFDPDLRYCSEMATTRDMYFGTTWWMDSCGMLGGSSGGPWIQNMDPQHGVGLVVGVNSWGYSSRAGMGAAIIDADKARCLVNHARNLPDITAFDNTKGGNNGEFISGTCELQSGDIMLRSASIKPPSGSGDPVSDI